MQARSFGTVANSSPKRFSSSESSMRIITAPVTIANAGQQPADERGPSLCSRPASRRGGQVDGMADTRANAGGHQAVVVMSGANLRQTAELGQAEVGSGAGIDDRYPRQTEAPQESRSMASNRTLCLATGLSARRYRST